MRNGSDDSGTKRTDFVRTPQDVNGEVGVRNGSDDSGTKRTGSVWHAQMSAEMEMQG